MEWLTQNDTKKLIDQCSIIKNIETEKEWMQAGLDRHPAVLYINQKDKEQLTFLNYYAVDALEKIVPVDWRLPSVKDWLSIQRKEQIHSLKHSLIGGLTPFGNRTNETFSVGYWTADNVGERHAFKVLLTDLNDKIYPRNGVKTEGNLVTYIKQ